MATRQGPEGSGLAIGGLSERTGCTAETIRYYERIGLMPPPPRTMGGHRVYDGPLAKRLGFICRSRSLGFTLKEVRELLHLVDAGDYTCRDVKSITQDHLGEVRRKIADLQKLEAVLRDAVTRCDGGNRRECPILETLYD